MKYSVGKSNQSSDLFRTLRDEKTRIGVFSYYKAEAK